MYKNAEHRDDETTDIPVDSYIKQQSMLPSVPRKNHYPRELHATAWSCYCCSTSAYTAATATTIEGSHICLVRSMVKTATPKRRQKWLYSKRRQTQTTPTVLVKPI